MLPICLSPIPSGSCLGMMISPSPALTCILLRKPPPPITREQISKPPAGTNVQPKGNVGIVQTHNTSARDGNPTVSFQRKKAAQTLNCHVKIRKAKTPESRTLTEAEDCAKTLHRLGLVSPYLSSDRLLRDGLLFCPEWFNTSQDLRRDAFAICKPYKRSGSW